MKVQEEAALTVSLPANSPAGFFVRRLLLAVGERDDRLRTATQTHTRVGVPARTHTRAPPAKLPWDYRTRRCYTNPGNRFPACTKQEKKENSRVQRRSFTPVRVIYSLRSDSLPFLLSPGPSSPRVLSFPARGSPGREPRRETLTFTRKRRREYAAARPRRRAVSSLEAAFANWKHAKR